LIADALSPRQDRVPLGDVLVVASLGGIGFTVSLLMNGLAYAGDQEIAVEGTLAVLLGSVIAAFVGIIVTILRSRHYARAGSLPVR
jgi:NhaA family Na+:H+ antiporter